MDTSETPLRRLVRWFNSRAGYLAAGGAVLGFAAAMGAGLGAWEVLAAAGALYAAGAVLGEMVLPPGGPVVGKGSNPPALPADHRLAAVSAEVDGWRQQLGACDWSTQALEAAEQLLTAAAAALAGPAAADRADTVANSLGTTLDWYERALSWWRLEGQGTGPTVEFLRRVAKELERLS
ncbi:hypothetical protein ACFYNO_02205 [Kitasatospora sp. NPDC006697]|uniref:hypothetical protein n=1 Tax=Kitasatospora sp. NPDC006697 TaxID=3364020 RepID=UPI0036C9CBC0